MKPEFARVCALLTDTVTLLCKNGVTFSTELKIQGVIGITVDTEVFVVHINESYGEGTELYNATDLQLKADVAQISSHGLVPSSSYSSRARQKSKHPIKIPSLKNVVKIEPNFKCSSDGGQSEYPIDAKYDGGDGDASNRYDNDSKDKSPAMTSDAVFDVDGEDDVGQYGSTSLTDNDGMKQDFDESWARNASDEQASGHDSWDRNIDVPNWQSYSMSTGASGSASNMTFENNSSAHRYSSQDVLRTAPRRQGAGRRITAHGRMALEQMKREADTRNVGGNGDTTSRGFRGSQGQMVRRDSGSSTPSRVAGGSGRSSQKAASQRADGFSCSKLTVTNYVCNICNAQYKHHCNLLTHQIKAHGREKKKGTGRPLKNAGSLPSGWEVDNEYEITENADYA